MIQNLQALAMPDAEVEIVLHMRMNEAAPEIEITGYPYHVSNDAMTVQIWSADAFCEGTG